MNLQSVDLPIYLNAEVPKNVPKHRVKDHGFVAEDSAQSSQQTYVSDEVVVSVSSHSERRGLRPRLEQLAEQSFQRRDAGRGELALVRGRIELYRLAGMGAAISTDQVKGDVIVVEKDVNVRGRVR